MIDIRKRFAGGESIAALARTFRMSRGCIRNIVRRNTWKDLAVAVTAVTLALASSTTFAWNAVGHSVVAEIAWQQLSPEQRKGIIDTLKRHPQFGEDFLQQNDIPLLQGDKLHSLWDNLLGRSHRVNDIKRHAAELSNREIYRELWNDAAKKSDIRQWLAESYALVKAFVYDDAILTVVRRATPQQPIERITLSQDYLKAAGGHARERVLAAGLRLAVVLEDIVEVEAAAARASQDYAPAASMFTAPTTRSTANTATSSQRSHWLNMKTGQRHNSECR